MWAHISEVYNTFLTQRKRNSKWVGNENSMRIPLANHFYYFPNVYISNTYNKSAAKECKTRAMRLIDRKMSLAGWTDWN